jgi:hypothetical protein
MPIYEGNDPGVDTAYGHSGVDSGHRQVGVPLNFFPIRFQFVFVPKLVKQVV